MNVRVMVRKLNISKYQISTDKPYIVEPMSVETSDISDEESDIEQKENIDDQLLLAVAFSVPVVGAVPLRRVVLR